jgi:hypothetical protein
MAVYHLKVESISKEEFIVSAQNKARALRAVREYLCRGITCDTLNADQVLSAMGKDYIKLDASYDFGEHNNAG